MSLFLASPIKVDEMDVNDPVLSDIVTSDAAESKSSQSGNVHLNVS